jgi:hypothetical protein
MSWAWCQTVRNCTLSKRIQEKLRPAEDQKMFSSPGDESVFETSGMKGLTPSEPDLSVSI